MKTDLDRILRFVVFDRDLDENQLEDLFATYPGRIPEDFGSALLERIRQITRQYWSYRRVRKGYHKVLRGIIFLENVARFGYEGCQLFHDSRFGWRLEVKPELLKKK